MTISIMFSLYHVLPHIVMPFLTFCFRSVCAFVRVCLNYKKFFEGIMLVENEPPPSAKAGYGPGQCLSEETYKTLAPSIWCLYARGSKRSHIGGTCVTCRGLHILSGQ